MELISGIFGKPKHPDFIKQTPPITNVTQNADFSADEIRKEMAKRAMATRVSQLTQANIGRKVLGAG